MEWKKQLHQLAVEQKAWNEGIEALAADASFLRLWGEYIDTRLKEIKVLREAEEAAASEEAPPD